LPNIRIEPTISFKNLKMTKYVNMLWLNSPIIEIYAFSYTIFNYKYLQKNQTIRNLYTMFSLPYYCYYNIPLCYSLIFLYRRHNKLQVCLNYYIDTGSLKTKGYQTRCTPIQYNVIKLLSDLRQSVVFPGYSGFLHQ
jgi:hypothetical protein